MDERHVAAALRGRGGVHQAMELEVELEDVELGDDSRCPLAEALIEMLCMAEISFPQANWLARCARQSDP